jgi:hypothetical protein
MLCSFLLLTGFECLRDKIQSAAPPLKTAKFKGNPDNNKNSARQ